MPRPVGSGIGVAPVGIVADPGLESLDHQDGKVGHPVVGEHGIQQHLHPAGSGIVGERSAIDQGVTGEAVVTRGQGAGGGVLHIDAHRFDRIHIGPAAFVIGQRFNGAGNRDGGGQIDRLMHAVVVIAVDRIALGGGAGADHDLDGSADLHQGGLGGGVGPCRGVEHKDRH